MIAYTYSLKKLNILLKRNPNAHKGENGKVLVIAGSDRYAGAAILASVAALRVGADMVTLACPRAVGMAVNRYCPDIITLKLPGDYLKDSHYNLILAEIKKADVMHIGNGIGRNPSTIRLVRRLLKNPVVRQMPKVIDADALRMISLPIENAILTPHTKEFAALLENSRINPRMFETNCKKYLKNSVVIVKGRLDRIYTSNEVYVNRTGNAGMAKAGTGDILSGICSGFLAKTKDITLSAKAAAWFNGYCGDQLKKKKGYFFIASDFLDLLKSGPARI